MYKYHKYYKYYKYYKLLIHIDTVSSLSGLYLEGLVLPETADPLQDGQLGGAQGRAAAREASGSWYTRTMSYLNS